MHAFTSRSPGPALALRLPETPDPSRGRVLASRRAPRARAPSAVSGPIQTCSMACSPAYFDSHGRWTSSAPSDFNDGWVCPLWATSKHWCSARNATIGRRWVSPPECKVPSTLDLLGGAEVSSSRRHVFYFVGDSQMPDLHEGFVCRLLLDGRRHQVPVRLVRRRLAPPWRNSITLRTYSTPDFTNLTNPAIATTAADEIWCDEVAVGTPPAQATVVSCRVQANLFVADVALQLILRQIAVRGRDTIILNEGLWHNSATWTHGTLRALLASLHAPCSALIGSGVRVLWRETSPQHFNTPTGSFKPWKSMQWSSKCTSTRMPNRANSKLLQDVEDAGMPIIYGMMIHTLCTPCGRWMLCY